MTMTPEFRALIISVASADMNIARYLETLADAVHSLPVMASSDTFRNSLVRSMREVSADCQQSADRNLKLADKGG